MTTLILIPSRQGETLEDILLHRQFICANICNRAKDLGNHRIRLILCFLS